MKPGIIKDSLIGSLVFHSPNAMKGFGIRPQADIRIHCFITIHFSEWKTKDPSNIVP